MATLVDYARLRSDIGADGDTFDDIEADEIYAEAAEDYSGTASIKAATRVIAIQRLWASSAKLTTYQANNSMEKLEDVFTHIGELLNRWEARLDAAVAAENAAAYPGITPPPSFTTRLRASW